MLDGVLRWLVQVTGLEPKLLSIIGILIVYASSVYLNAKKVVPAILPQMEALGAADMSEVVSILERVERGTVAVAKYLVNQEDKRIATEQTGAGSPECPFFPSRSGVGAPPLSHHNVGLEGVVELEQVVEEVEEEDFYPISPLPQPAALQPGFFKLPVPIVVEPVELVDVQEPVPMIEEVTNVTEEPQASQVVRDTLRIMSERAGRSVV